MPNRTGQRIPSFRFGRGIKHGVLWVNIRFAVNSRLACARSDIVTLYVKRPSITASSADRACIIFGVTGPMPAEFSVKAPSFNGSVFVVVVW
jgi:hypothetical protein